MENTIPVRIYDFLKGHPPFHLFDKNTLLDLAAQAIVQYRPKGELVFQQGAMPGGLIFVLKEGAIHLFHEEKGERELVDQCDEGELFGLRPLLADDAYALTAVAAEETLLYAIPVESFREAAEQAPGVLMYIASNFASGWQRRTTPESKGKIFAGQNNSGQEAFQLVEIQSIERSKSPVVCRPEQPIQEAAGIMTEKEVGSIIVVNEHRHPIGIVTDKDLRKKAATGRVPISAPVSEIMSQPVITAHPSITVADVQMRMVKHKIHHLCLTENGNNDAPVVGVLTEHDLLVVQGNNPAVFLREIKRAQTTSELLHIRERAEQLLEKYIRQEVAIAYIASIITEINDALIQRVIRLAEQRMDAEGRQRPTARYCWLALGSEGREEQLLRTDQDNALVFEDVPEQAHEATKSYYLQLSGYVTTMLNECGFEYCPAEMMASNPNWCLSLSEWKEQFSKWMLEPDPQSVMMCTIFFDYRPVYGLSELPEALTAHIFSIIDQEKIFLSFLAKNALENPPPLTFFRDFMVERSGEHQHEFDIKARAMMPLTDAARVLVLFNKVAMVNNTFKRFEELAQREPGNRELYEQAADAYEILMRYRTLQGLKQRDSGRFFNPSELSKMERILLRNSFRPIQDLQSLLKTRFQLGFF
ncbi:MAG TPA: DUF294 nucleotidyltransferase-like domain-containing protein [Saprospiraceae bacterium]|nr:DUF294 nucleotidyltransferase-like domain-containing protein [Saprospiraceae bacterium]